MRNPIRPKRERLARRLTTIRQKVTEHQQQIRVLDQQVVHLRQVAADAETDAVVADNSIAAREHHAAQTDLRRAERQCEEVRAKLDGLLVEQDTLLEQMLD